MTIWIRSQDTVITLVEPERNRLLGDSRCFQMVYGPCKLIHLQVWVHLFLFLTHFFSVPNSQWKERLRVYGGGGGHTALMWRWQMPPSSEKLPSAGDSVAAPPGWGGQTRQWQWSLRSLDVLWVYAFLIKRKQFIVWEQDRVSDSNLGSNSGFTNHELTSLGELLNLPWPGFFLPLTESNNIFPTGFLWRWGMTPGKGQHWVPFRGPPHCPSPSNAL